MTLNHSQQTSLEAVHVWPTNKKHFSQPFKSES